jgi:hypothetical protein
MGELKRGERLQIMLTDDELLALDDWRFAARMPSRAAAIRELLKRGLAAEGYTDLQARTKSGDFGVLASGAESEHQSLHQQPQGKPGRRVGLAPQPDGHDDSN